MKYKWAQLVTEMRNAMLELTTIEGIDAEHTVDLMGYLRETMHSTDTYHAWDYDLKLEKAFEKMPSGRCNYRSLASYWAHKQGKERLIDAMCEYLEEMSWKIEDHFMESWNFPPGYVKPKSIRFSSFDYKVTKILARTIRRVKM